MLLLLFEYFENNVKIFNKPCHKATQLFNSSMAQNILKVFIKNRSYQQKEMIQVLYQQIKLQ